MCLCALVVRKRPTANTSWYRPSSSLLSNLAKAVNFHLARRGLVKPALPITLTFSVTNRCQSRCKTCLIWKFYEDRPELVRDELSLDEIENVFRSMGKTVFFNISGGEPFLRDDLPDIVALALEHLRPNIVHIPTNALMPERIERQVRAMLEHIDKTSPGVKLSVKPSLDGLYEQHDDIRGVPGGFDKVIKTIEMLLPLSKRYPNFILEVGTVISRLNSGSIDEIASFVHSLGVQSYRVYYDLAVKTLRERRQVIPCYAGVSNAHLDPYGNVWPCCTMANDASLGNVRSANYDFLAVWHSHQADAVRTSIRRGECFCPLANQAYSNILLSPVWLLRAAISFIRFCSPK